MLKRFSVGLIVILGMALWVKAQDLPALPPLPGDTSSSSAALPALPGENAVSTSSALPALPDASGSSASTSSSLPALPGESATPAPAAGDKPAVSEKELKKQKKEDEKALKKLNKERKKQGLEPLTELPKEGTPAAPAASSSAALLALPGETTAAAPSAGLPALPGEAAPASAGLPALPGEAAATPAVEANGNTVAPAAKKAKLAMKKWHAPDFGPNVIFGGVVKTKGGTDEEKLAWVSQFVLNGMDFGGYDVLKEEGAYAGQQVDKEWRQFTFVHRKKKSTAPICIYVEPAKGDNVWLRVGPSEPPAGVPAKEVRRIRVENQQVLKIMQKQLKGALRPVGGRWEAPFRRING